MKNGKLSIAMVSDYFYPNLGGIETHIELLAKHLQKLNCHIIIITHKYTKPGIKNLNGILIYYLNIPTIAMNTTFPNLLSNCNTLKKIFEDEQIDVVHGHQSMSNLALEAVFHAQTMGLKTVFTEHSVFEKGGFENIIVNKLCELILRGTDRFICVSYTSKENLMDRINVGNEEVYVIPNAVVSNIFYPKSKDNTRISSNKNTIDTNQYGKDYGLFQNNEEMLRAQVHGNRNDNGYKIDNRDKQFNTIIDDFNKTNNDEKNILRKRNIFFNKYFIKDAVLFKNIYYIKFLGIVRKFLRIVGKFLEIVRKFLEIIRKLFDIVKKILDIVNKKLLDMFRKLLGTIRTCKKITNRKNNNHNSNIIKKENKYREQMSIFLDGIMQENKINQNATTNEMITIKHNNNNKNNLEISKNEFNISSCKKNIYKKILMNKNNKTLHKKDGNYRILKKRNNNDRNAQKVKENLLWIKNEFNSNNKENIQKDHKNNFFIVKKHYNKNGSINNKKKNLNTYKKKIKIVVMSRLVSRKGIDILIKVIPILFLDIKNIKIIIAGDGPKRDELEQMIDSYNLKDKVKLIGEVEHKNVGNILRYGDIFLNVSLTEAFCMAILEAAACGLEVVSTNVGGICEVMPDSMIILTSIEENEIIKGIKKSIEKLKYKKLNEKKFEYKKGSEKKRLKFNVSENSVKEKIVNEKNIFKFNVYENKDFNNAMMFSYTWENVAAETLKVYESIEEKKTCMDERIKKYHWLTEIVCRFFIAFEYFIFYILSR
ncbi:hypothetical protein COBT_001563 [Conglomerata obtusa]